MYVECACIYRVVVKYWKLTFYSSDVLFDSKYHLIVGEMISQPLSSMRHKCNRLWFNNVLNKYVQYANIIKELIDVKEGYCNKI